MINFFNEDVSFKAKHIRKTKAWLHSIASNEGFELTQLNYLFCSDDYVLDINRQYLDHDFYTDIITFDNSEIDKQIEGDIFISIDRIRDNASSLNVSFESEFLRVLAHGLLHLVGFDDATEEQKSLMRKREDFYLNLFEIK